jgi:hypothetical protein
MYNDVLVLVREMLPGFCVSEDYRSKLQAMVGLRVTREGKNAGQVSPATFDNLQDCESVRMANAKVSG